MAEKQVEEGTREPGEQIPTDDSHIADAALKAIQAAADKLQNNEGDDTISSGEGQPEMVDVEIDGTTYNMPKEAVEALNRKQAALLEDNTPAPTDTVEGEPEKTDFQTLFYTDPEAAAEKIKEEVREELRNEYLQDKALDIFWQDFYSENPELKEEDMFVRMVLASKMDDLKNLKGKQGRDGLADAVRSELLRIQNKTKGAKKPSGTENLEGALPGTSETASGEPVKPQTPSKVHTLGDALRERNIARRKAAGKSV